MCSENFFVVFTEVVSDIRTKGRREDYKRLGTHGMGNDGNARIASLTHRLRICIVVQADELGLECKK